MLNPSWCQGGRDPLCPYAVPPFDLTPTDMAGFLDELRAFHGVFHSCFVRREPREHFFHYMAGQLSALERKSIEPMALHVEGGKVRGLQRFISEDVWQEDKMGSQALSPSCPA
jgi:hypothetical protein